MKKTTSVLKLKSWQCRSIYTSWPKGVTSTNCLSFPRQPTRKLVCSFRNKTSCNCNRCSSCSSSSNSRWPISRKKRRIRVLKLKKVRNLKTQWCKRCLIWDSEACLPLIPKEFTHKMLPSRAYQEVKQTRYLWTPQWIPLWACKWAWSQWLPAKTNPPMVHTKLKWSKCKKCSNSLWTSSWVSKIRRTVRRGNEAQQFKRCKKGGKIGDKQPNLSCYDRVWKVGY